MHQNLVSLHSTLYTGCRESGMIIGSRHLLANGAVRELGTLGVVDGIGDSLLNL